MNRDTVIALAREAELWEICEGFSNEYGSGEAEEDCLPTLIRFAALVAAHEREECAKVCDEQDHNGVMIAADCAAAIRSKT